MVSWIGRQVGQFAFGSVAVGLKALLTPVSFGACALIVDPDGRVALVRHTYMSGWALPGGGVKRAEPPADAVLREMREELGTLCCDAPVLFGLYTRRSGWATNVIAVYRLMNSSLDYRPNFEISDLEFFDPAAPPPDSTAGTLRRLAEFTGKAPLSAYW